MNATASPIRLPQSPRDRRIAAVAILALVALLIAAAVVVPVVFLHRHYDDNLSRLYRQWRSQSAFNAQRPVVTRALETLKARDVRRLFLKGTTSALATAELQDQVRQVIEANGGKLNSASGNPNKDEAGYRLASANFQLNISGANLRRLLHALESREPYLFIDNLVIRSQTPFGFRPVPGTPEPDLFIQMDVSGVGLIGGDSGAPKAAAGAKS